VYRHHPLSPALGVSDTDQTAVEVNVVPVQAKQLRAAQAAVGKQREQRTVALALACVNATPHALLAGHVQEAGKL
jgi:hypothetical protein